MSTRKIKISTTPGKLEEILDKLGATLIIEVPENKQTYSTLSNDPDILDWEFIEDAAAEESQAQTKNDEDPYEVQPDSFNSLACWITAVWMLSRKSPEIKYDTVLWKNGVHGFYENVCNQPTGIEIMSLKTLLEIYYKDDLETAIKDTKEKVGLSWKYFSSHPSVLSVANLLYRK